MFISSTSGLRIWTNIQGTNIKAWYIKWKRVTGKKQNFSTPLYWIMKFIAVGYHWGKTHRCIHIRKILMEAGPIDRCLVQWLRCLFWVMMSPEARKTFVFLLHLPKYALSHHSVWATGLDRLFSGLEQSDLCSGGSGKWSDLFEDTGKFSSRSSYIATASKIPLFCFFKNLILSKDPWAHTGLWGSFIAD